MNIIDSQYQNRCNEIFYFFTLIENMGQEISCNCVTQALGIEDKEFRERIDMLIKGQKFMRSAFLGMSQREVFLNLTEDMSTMKWKANKTTFSSEEMDEIDLTSVKMVKMSGSSSMQFIGEGEKSLFEVSSEDPNIRDQWVIALNEILQGWALKPETKPKCSKSAAGTTNKDAYFAKRQEEILEREAKAKEMKAKYASGGMKYTAIAMANRPG